MGSEKIKSFRFADEPLTSSQSFGLLLRPAILRFITVDQYAEIIQCCSMSVRCVNGNLEANWKIARKLRPGYPAPNVYPKQNLSHHISPTRYAYLCLK